MSRPLAPVHGFLVRKILVRWVLALGIATVPTAATEVCAAQQRVALLGDSITVGARIAAPELYAPPAQLAGLLERAYEVRGFGAGGHTLRASADQPYVTSRAFRDAVEFAPDVAIVMLGTNDTVQTAARPNWAPSRDLTADVAAIVGPLRGANEGVRVLLASPPTMLPAAPGLSEARAADLAARAPRIVALSQSLREIAESMDGVEFVDMTRSLRHKHVTDGVHPNAFGAQCIAWRFAAAVRFEAATAPAPLDVLTQRVDDALPSRFHGFRRVDFDLPGEDSATATLVAPDRIAAGRPWVWRARFFGHRPQLDLALLDRGYHLAYVDVAGLFGAPAAVARMRRFQDLCEGLGLGPKPVLEGMSRGGLAALEYAKAHPARVSAVYGDNPVCDVRSWPGGRTGKRSDPDWRACLEAWGLDEAAAWAFEGGPLVGLEPLAAAGVPLYLVMGLADDVVPPVENGERLATAYARAGGTVEVWRKPGLRHHPHGLDPVDPLLRAILRTSPRTSGDFEVTPTVLAAPAVEFRGKSAGWGGGTWADAFASLQGIELAAREGPPLDVVFLGDSITQGLTGHGDRYASAEQSRVFDRYQGARRAVSLGLSGDRTEHLLHRIRTGSLDGFRPRVVVLQIGVNNLNAGGHTASETFDGIVHVVAELRERLPQTKVLISGPLAAGVDPQSRLRRSITEVHARLATQAFDDSVAYLDLTGSYVNEDGTLNDAMSRDGIHISARGQEIWMSGIEAQLRLWLDER